MSVSESQKNKNKMLRAKNGQFASIKRILQFEIILLGSVAVLGLMIYFWTPIAIHALGEKIAVAYTQDLK